MIFLEGKGTITIGGTVKNRHANPNGARAGRQQRGRQAL
jgi:hypothetical protein